MDPDPAEPLAARSCPGMLRHQLLACDGPVPPRADGEERVAHDETVAVGLDADGPDLL